MQLVARFYARRSMRRELEPRAETDLAALIAIAALFVAWKVENRECRRALPMLRALAVEGVKQWYFHTRSWSAPSAATRPAPPSAADLDLRDKLRDATYLRRLNEDVIRAEFELLVALGFNLHVDLPQEQLAGPGGIVALASALAPTLRHLRVQETFVTACHRVATHDPRLCLQFSAHAIALALCHFIFSRYDAGRALGEAPRVPPPGPDGSPWYVAAGLPDADWREIHARLCLTYPTAPRG